MEMKTLEEIKKHCKENGYSRDAMFKICGWLVAKGIKESDEPIPYKEGYDTFDNFVAWFEGKESFMKDLNMVYVNGNLVWIRKMCGDKFIGTNEFGTTKFYDTRKATKCENEEEIKRFAGALNALFEKYGNDAVGFYQSNLTLPEEEEFFEDALKSHAESFESVAETEGAKNISKSLYDIVNTLSAEELTEDEFEACKDTLKSVAETIGEYLQIDEQD